MRTIIILLLFYSANNYAESCISLFNKILNANSSPFYLTDSIKKDNPLYKKLTKKIGLKLRTEASKIKIPYKNLKKLSDRNKERILALYGIGLSLGTDVSGREMINYQNVTFPGRLDNLKIIFEKAKLREIDINDAVRLTFDLPKDQQNQVLKILTSDLESNKALQKLLEIVQKLSNNKTKSIYDSRLWDFIVMDFSSPIVALTTELMKKAFPSLSG